jgi:hypothetical protein
MLAAFACSMKPLQQRLFALFWYSSNKETLQQINYGIEKKLQYFNMMSKKLIQYTELKASEKKREKNQQIEVFRKKNSEIMLLLLYSSKI